MLTYATRRLILAIPTLLFISFVIFMLLQLAPGDPMAQVPLTVPDEVKQKMREALGLGAPPLVQYWKWLVQIFWIEPQVLIDHLFGTHFAWHWDTPTEALSDSLRATLSEAGRLREVDGVTQVLVQDQRVISWQTRSPVMDIILQRIPQTLWVVGVAYIVAILIALPIGVYSAYKQYSVFDQAGTFVTMIGFSIPPFFTGPLLIVIFSVQLGWFPSIYDTTHQVTDWASFKFQLQQMIMPVMVLALQITAQLSRYMRASMLDNLGQDYVRTARAKGLSEAIVVNVHVLRNSMIPVVTVIALGIPAIFGGAIITESVFKVNGIGQLLLTALFANDLPMVMTLTFIFAVLIVLFNLIADVLYGLLDPRIRYD
ncbi:ABC transporter permease [Sagittula sp. SSi028]|uniref:ABC transporter permease n=1 Tax=Sagittula sp. SSi028 TaxID=3400636 RepID=UPI003AF87090